MRPIAVQRKAIHEAMRDAEHDLHRAVTNEQVDEMQARIDALNDADKTLAFVKVFMDFIKSYNI